MLQDKQEQEGALKNPPTGNATPDKKEAGTANGDNQEYSDAEKAAFARFQKEKAKAKELEDRLAQLEKEKATEEERKAIEAGNLKEVIDKQKAKIAELESIKSKVDYSESVISSYLEKEIESIPEEMRSLIPSGMSPQDKLKYIADNKHLLTKKFDSQARPIASGTSLPKSNGGVGSGDELSSLKAKFEEIVNKSRSGAYITEREKKELTEITRQIETLEKTK